MTIQTDEVHVLINELIKFKRNILPQMLACSYVLRSGLWVCQTQVMNLLILFWRNLRIILHIVLQIRVSAREVKGHLHRWSRPCGAQVRHPKPKPPNPKAVNPKTLKV
jgi:hypothetical protein